MKRLAVVFAVVLLAGAATGSAFAFDCIRVSSSPRGLMQSANSGHWLPFNFGSPEGFSQTFSLVFDMQLTEQQAACLFQHYSTSTLPNGAPVPLYFALGIGVAGGFHNGPGVLAWHNMNDAVLSNGRGIDHIDIALSDIVDSVTTACNVTPPDEG